MDRESVRFFLRKSQTEPKRASDSCKPGGLSTPGGCVTRRGNEMLECAGG